MSMRLAGLMVWLTCVLYSATAFAGSVKMYKNPHSDGIILEASRASAIEILRKLDKHDRISVRNWPQRNFSRLRSGRWQGDVATVLSQILRKLGDHSYILKRQVADGGAMLEVMFLGLPLEQNASVRQQAGNRPSAELDGQPKASKTTANSAGAPSNIGNKPKPPINLVKADAHTAAPDQIAELQTPPSVASQHAQKIAALFSEQYQPTQAFGRTDFHRGSVPNTAAAMTQSLVANVGALARGLKAICIAGSCTRRPVK